MTIPTIFSDIAANNGELQRGTNNGNLYAEYATIVVPAATAALTFLGAVRMFKNDVLVGFVVDSADLTSGTDVLLDVGYTYDDTTTYTEDPNAFLDGLDICQDGGSRLYPVADSTLAKPAGWHVWEADGYLSLQTTDGATVTQGNIVVRAIVGRGLGARG